MIDPKTKTKIFQAIRKAFVESDRYSGELEKALSKKRGPRGGRRYDCAICGEAFDGGELDHWPESVTPLDRRAKDMTVDEYYQRVFELPVRFLCKPCHKQHTRDTNRKRK